MRKDQGDGGKQNSIQFKFGQIKSNTSRGRIGKWKGKQNNTKFKSYQVKSARKEKDKYVDSKMMLCRV